MSAELKHFKKTLSQYEPSEIKRIHVIASMKHHQTHLTKIIKNQQYEEFPGFQSTLVAPYAGAFNPALVMAAIKELAREDKRFAVARKDWNIGRAVDAVTYSTKEDFEKKMVFDSPNTVLIDMTQIEFLIDPGILQKNEPSLSADAKTGGGAASFFRETSGSTQLSIAARSNQCKGGTSISGGDYPGFPASQAFDEDDTSSRWGSLQTGRGIRSNAYIGYDFGAGKEKHIRRMGIRQGGAIGSIKMQRSSNGKDWQDVKSLDIVTDNNMRFYDLPGSGASRYWRILANADLGDGPSAWTVYDVKMMEKKEKV